MNFDEMTDPSLFAFYGSLRRGMRLYNQFHFALQYHYSAWLKGYELYSLGNYPYAVKSAIPDRKILVEIFSITEPEVEKEIFDLEVGAGYHLVKQTFDDRVINIFLYDDTSANNMRVHSGDWVTFFRQ
jgi:gamma-glutamylcyclotransferase (GGCT)/AIG2-like uncharacterized protein YtfP